MNDWSLLWNQMNAIGFPHPHEAPNDGPAAIGGDLSIPVLLKAYYSGFFPWFMPEDPILWWSPNPRMILLPHKIKIHHSMKSMLHRSDWNFQTNKAFPEVIHACAEVRKQSNDTWLSSEMIQAYLSLHHLGLAHSFEAYHRGCLVGGLYGICLGGVFFGESMFHKETNASKYALILTCQNFQKSGIKLIDCQVYTPHLEYMGAELMPRNDFLKHLNQHLPTAEDFIHGNICSGMSL